MYFFKGLEKNSSYFDCGDISWVYTDTKLTSLYLLNLYNLLYTNYTATKLFFRVIYWLLQREITKNWEKNTLELEKGVGPKVRSWLINTSKRLKRKIHWVLIIRDGSLASLTLMSSNVLVSLLEDAIWSRCILWCNPSLNSSHIPHPIPSKALGSEANISETCQVNCKILSVNIMSQEVRSEYCFMLSSIPTPASFETGISAGHSHTH